MGVVFFLHDPKYDAADIVNLSSHPVPVLLVTILLSQLRVWRLSLNVERYRPRLVGYGPSYTVRIRCDPGCHYLAYTLIGEVIEHPVRSGEYDIALYQLCP